MSRSIRNFGIVTFLIIGFAGYVSMSVAGFAATSGGLPQQQKKSTKSTNQARMATASVTIHGFYKEVPSGRMVVSTGGAPSTRIIATYGDKVTFCWRFNACNANVVTVNLSSVGNVEPGTRTDLGNQCVQYRGSQEVTLTEDKTYTLRVNAFPGGPNSVAEKSLQVELKRYGLVMEEPTLDTSTREVKFYARNNGDLDIPEKTIMVHYRITGVVRGGPGASIASDWVNRRHLAIPRGQRVMLGSLHIPESARVYRQMNVRFKVYGDHYGFGDNIQTFSLFWERKQLKFNRVILEALITSIIGDVRFNNYDPSKRTGELSPSAPFKRNDSWVEMLGERSTFTPDEIRLALEIMGSASGHVYKTYHYRAFINNLGLGGRVPELLLRPNQIGIRLVFDTSVSREVKGFLREDDGRYHDEHGPDIEFRELMVDILLTPVLRDQKISFSRVSASTVVDTQFAGGWNVLDRFAPRISNTVESYIRDIVNSQIKSLLDTNANKRRVEDLFDGLLAAGRISHIQNIVVDSEGITVNCQ